MLIHLIITEKCNMRCSYCYEQKEICEKTEFGEDDICALIRFIVSESSSSKSLWINFHGGEPLLKFELIKRVVHEVSRVRTTYFSITTNVTLLSDEIIDFLFSNNFYISCSVDGNEKTQNTYRKYKNGEDSFQDVYQKLNLLNKKLQDFCLINKEIRQNIRYRMTVTPETVRYLYENIQYLIALGAENIAVVPEYYKFHWKHQDICIFKTKIESAEQYVENNGLNVQIVHPFGQDVYSPCSQGKNEITVSANGDVFPCVFAYNRNNWKIGTIKRGIDNKNIIAHEGNTGSFRQICVNCKLKNTCIAYRCIYLDENSKKALCEFRMAFDDVGATKDEMDHICTFF